MLMSFPQILAVGADPLLTRLNMNGDIISQIPCAPTSAFSISLHPSGVSSVLIDYLCNFSFRGCWCRKWAWSQTCCMLRLRTFNCVISSSLLHWSYDCVEQINLYKMKKGNNSRMPNMYFFLCQVAAVSGCGALVDMISQFGSHLCTFRCRGL